MEKIEVKNNNIDNYNSDSLDMNDTILFNSEDPLIQVIEELGRNFNSNCEELVIKNLIILMLLGVLKK